MMRSALFAPLLVVCLMVSPACAAGGLEGFFNIILPPSINAPPQEKSDIIAGLKEALALGTKNAVKELSATDGYFGNKAVKILLPDNIRKIEKALRFAGYDREVDVFILSMNRAAENAAPQAADIFAGAIRSMTFDDAKKILNGGNTAATDFFKSKTSTQLFDALKPEVSRSMNEVGVTKAYKALVERYTSIMPFVKMESLDLDRYVTGKSLDGLFYMLGEEETKIRTNPAARTTELLQKVFGYKP
jgi:hypothetical protein